jgi:hypothetical protein
MPPTKSRSPKTDGKSKQTDSKSKQTDGKSKQTDGKSKQTDGKSKQTDGKSKQTADKKPSQSTVVKQFTSIHDIDGWNEKRRNNRTKQEAAKQAENERIQQLHRAEMEAALKRDAEREAQWIAARERAALEQTQREAERREALLEKLRKEQEHDTKKSKEREELERIKEQFRTDLQNLSHQERASFVLQSTGTDLAQLLKTLHDASKMMGFPSNYLSQLQAAKEKTPVTDVCFEELREMMIAVWTTIKYGGAKNHEGKCVCICKSSLCADSRCGFAHAEQGDVVFGECRVAYGCFLQAWMCIGDHKFVALNLWLNTKMHSSTKWTINSFKRLLRAKTTAGYADTRYEYGCLGCPGEEYGLQRELPPICKNPSPGNLCDEEHCMEYSDYRAYINNYPHPRGIHSPFLQIDISPLTFSFLNLFGDPKYANKITPARFVNMRVGSRRKRLVWPEAFASLAEDWMSLPITPSWRHATEAIRVAVNSVAPTVWNPTEVVSMLLLLKHLLRCYIALLPMYHNRYPFMHDYNGFNAPEWQFFAPMLGVAYRIPDDVAFKVCEFL